MLGQPAVGGCHGLPVSVLLHGGRHGWHGKLHMPVVAWHGIAVYAGACCCSTSQRVTNVHSRVALGYAPGKGCHHSHVSEDLQQVSLADLIWRDGVAA